MKNYTNLLLLFALVLSISFAGCGKDDEKPDTEGPILDLSDEKSDPFENRTYTRGGALPLNATFKDASGMKSCAVTITYNDVAPKTQLKGIGSPWTPAENEDVDNLSFEGKKGGETITKEQLFGQNIEAACLGGIYTITFDMEDMVGNKSQKKVNINIGN